MVVACLGFVNKPGPRFRPIPLNLADSAQNRLQHAGWSLFVLQRLHGIAGPSLRQAADLSGVPEHLPQGGFGLDHRQIAAAKAIGDDGPPRVQIGLNASQEVFGEAPSVGSLD